MTRASCIKEVKAEVEGQEKKLTELGNKWNSDSVLKSVSDCDQTKVFKAVVMAKMLTSTLIPKFKFKVDLFLRKPENLQLYDDVITNWKLIEPKISRCLEQFKNLEYGTESFSTGSPTRYSKGKDKMLSKAIEKSLREGKNSMKQLASKESSSIEYETSFSEGNCDSASGESIELSSENVSFVGVSKTDLKKDEILQLEKKLTAGKKIMNDLKGKISSKQESLNTIDLGLKSNPEIQSLKNQLRNMFSSSCKKNIEKLGEARNEKQSSDHKDRTLVEDVRSFNSSKFPTSTQFNYISKTDRKNKKSGLTNLVSQTKKLSHKANKLPSPLPIDDVLNFVDNLPAEVQKMVRAQTQALTNLKKQPIFGTSISDRNGELVSMNMLSETYRDDRFDAGDFYLRVNESLIDPEHLSRLKECKIDDAVGRCFGSYQGPSNDCDPVVSKNTEKLNNKSGDGDKNIVEPSPQKHQFPKNSRRSISNKKIV